MKYNVICFLKQIWISAKLRNGFLNLHTIWINVAGVIGPHCVVLYSYQVYTVNEKHAG